MGGFILGLIIGGCLGIAVMAFITASRDNNSYIELKKDNEVEE